MKRRDLHITLITAGVHSLLLFLAPMVPLHHSSEKKPIPMRVVTKEITPPHSKPTFVAASSNSNSKESQAKEIPVQSFTPDESPPPPKKTMKTSEVKPKKAPIKPEKSVKAVRGKLEKNVANIKKQAIKHKSKTPNVPYIGTKEKAPSISSKVPTINGVFGEAAGDDPHLYLESVSAQLREWLVLPEKGVVKLTITVQPNGKIVNIRSLSSESEKNLEYLQCVLSGIQLPPYGKKEEMTFTITFCDD